VIWKNLFRRKSRTLLTTLGIAIGVAAVVALGALADGFVTGYGDMVGGSGADLLVIQEDALDIAFSSVEQQVGERLAGYSGVTAVSEMVYTFAATENVPYFIVYGYDPGDFALEHFRIVEGGALSHHPVRQGGRPLLLGHSAAADMELGVGDTLRLYETIYRVVGIYETGKPIEDGSALILIEDAQTISGKPHQVNAFLLQVRPGTDMERLRARIEQRYPDLTTTTSTSFSQDQETLQYVRAFRWGVSFVALLIGAVGVMNTVLMSVFERTREIGVLRAVGWRPRRVLGMVLKESLALSVLGGTIGLLLGMGAARAVQSVPTISSFMPATFAPGLLAQGMGVALGLGLIGGGIPAWRASRLTPAEAMRNEAGSGRVARHVRSALLRSMLRQPIRTLLTVIGITIAVMAIVLLQAMGTGMIDEFGGVMGGLGAQLIGSEAGASVDLSKIDENVIRRLNMLPEVRAAEGFLTGYTQVGDLPVFIVFGYQPRGLAIREFAVVEGEPLRTNRQLLLGRVAAENLNRDVGDTLRLFNSAYEIVGIYETGVSFQDGGAVISLRAAQRLFGQPNKVSFLSVWLEDPEQADAVIHEIETRFPEVDVGKASEFVEGLSDMEMMRAATWGIAALALVVGGLGMTNTMIMSVLERTREIGVLRAVGWRKRRVLAMIVRESVTLAVVGGLAGTVLGVVGGLLINLSPVMQGLLQLRFSPGLYAQALGTAILLGVLGGVYPAWRASNLQPVEALRYE
jgi:ABC-type antimicrobial peptide transport system permease subunit